MWRNWTELDRPARRFITASAVSFVGDGMRYAALPLLAAQHGAGPTELGVLLGFATLPFLVLGIFGGVLADRMRRRSLLIACDVLRLVVMGGFVLALATGHVPLPVMYGVAFLMGLLESVATSATFAFLPTLVAEKDLERANGMSSTALLLGRQFVGPLAGAALLEAGRTLPFALDAVTFLLSVALLATIARGVEEEPVGNPTGNGPRAVFADVRASARWMRVTPHVLAIAVSAAVINLFNSGALAVQPDFAERVLGGNSMVYALMMASSALGGVLGAQAAATLATRLTSPALVCLALLCVGSGYLVVAVSGLQLVAFAGLALTGVGFSFWGVATTSWRQRLTPAGLRGRADALHRMISWGVLPVGSVLGGLVAARWGSWLPFLLVGCAPLLLLPLFLRRKDGPTDRMVPADTGATQTVTAPAD
ncbi:MFS transporter [Actinacidiphila oryziradicis]|uniref:MFS transporter n=1 Tax=Actinacidiphila oryziradicis TaxID=2571141 RepID=A0A4U0SAV9_9ACTN|nr:MFS transporter [Actinacidiphila oryziradicis]TJZ97454.1 MFS transporter [Actinacidiphila oryziradicis]